MSKNTIKQCNQCNNPFNLYQVIDNVEYRLRNRKKCFNCNPFKNHEKRIIKTDGNIYKICRVCNKKLLLNNINFYVRPNGHFDSFCRDCNTIVTCRRHQTMKQRAIEYLGGHCIICKYSRFAGAMDCHHKDPQTKDKNIKLNKMGFYSWDVLKKELDKCVLLCTRCHREIHIDFSCRKALDNILQHELS